MRHVTAQQLSAFLDGALAGVSRELVTRHLAACADCRERHALWHIYDEVLQRLLSWEPNERTMEEASARVELTLTAERRGLPPPEFTSVLHPVIASTPGLGASPSASGLFPALPPVAPPPPAAPPAPVASAPPPPAPPPSHVPFMPVPSAQAYPLDPPAMTPPAAPPPPVATVPQYAAPSPPPAAAAQWYTPPSPPGYSPPISVYEDLRPHAEPSAVRWASVPLPRKRRRVGRLLLVCAGLLAAVLLASPWLPDVIRIRLPEEWGPRVPRVEFVRHDVPPAAPVATAPDPRVRLAERTSSEPPLVPYRALPVPADSAAARSTPADAPQADSVVRPPALPLTEHTAAKTHVPARSPAHARPRPAPREQTPEEDESGTAAGAEHSMTFVPIQVKTEVQLSSSQPSPPPPAAAAADTAGDQALPLLCGVVVDESGAPIEGARVQVMAPALTIRTDKRGRFCVALPAGERTFLVDAAGYAPVTRGVELSGPTFETHITLAAAR